MKLSVIYSIYNRTLLFSRGLETVKRQTMDPRDFELIVVDDSSTEDIKAILEPLKGQINIRYVRYDRTKHPIWQEMNPNGIEENWYHTQAISANIGLRLSQGDICCISQPEILHNPESFTNGWKMASNYKQVFAENLWATDQFNQWMDKGEWQDYSYDSLLEIATKFGKEYEPNHMPDQQHYEMYWYTEYFPRALALEIGGVDLKYQCGVYAEDDQFRARMRMGGATEMWGGRPNLDGPTAPYCVGIHQSHADEGKKNKKQDRVSRHWELGAERNRAIYREFCAHPYTVANENLDYDPFGEFLIIEDEYYSIS